MKKKILAMLLVTAFLTAGCGSSGESTKGEGSEKNETMQNKNDEPKEDVAKDDTGYKFGYTCMDGTNPFFVTLENAIREDVEANGDTLLSVDPANDVTLQIQQIEDLIAQDIDAMFLNPAEAEGILPALDQLKDAGIPIINFDTEVAELSYVEAYVGSDNYNAGKVCGDDLVEKVPNGGDIIVLDSPTMNSVVDRTSGFLDAIEGEGFNIVAQQDAKGNLEVSMGITEDLLQANPNVVAIFGGNDPTALGALAAANAAGITDAMIYGIDGSPDIKAELARENSLIEGTGAQSPVQIAKTSTKVMYEYLAGNKVEDRYPVETFLITADNVSEYGTDGWQ
ncbi:MAG: sugar ABC transporter substrate-binding protein [Lachnospirales bacterium]